jgi:UDP-N-acetylmuramate dehydrogenase
MKVFENFDLSKYNSYRIKAMCKVAYFPESELDIISLYRKKNDYVLLGSGHNVIMSKPYYDDDFLIFNGNFAGVAMDENDESIIIAESGITMQALSELAHSKGLSGLEVFYDIPSSLGGAVVMNAGASGEEVKDVLIKVRYLDLEDMKVKEIFREEIGFEYRNGFFQRHKDKVVLKAWLKLALKNESEILAKMTTIKAARWNKQPRDLPNAGSVFKRPKGYYVGAMIDELGLRGLRKGGAMVSLKHSGFIVNCGAATGEDILGLIMEIKEKVMLRFNVDLEVEQRII